MFVPDVPESPPIWLVCFAGREVRTPWDRFLTCGFRHAFLLGFVPGPNVWLLHETLYDRTNVAVVSSAIADRLLTTAVREGAVLEWRIGPPEPPRLMLRFGLWCVPAIKHVLGVRCVALTPKGLHDWLLRNGAKPVAAEAHEPVLDNESP